jgi:adenylate cyclase
LLDEMNRRGDVPPTRVGIGLHAGHAVTGNLGSPSRKEYAIIGSVVNTAARIEQLNKQFRSQLLVSAAVRDACANSLPAPDDLGDIPIKGQAAPLRLFKVA